MKLDKSTLKKERNSANTAFHEYASSIWEKVPKPGNLIMKKYKYLLSFLIIVIFSPYIYAQDSLFTKAEAFINGDSSVINLTMVNTGQNSLYIQNQFWEIGGNTKTNFNRFFPARGYIANIIYYIPQKDNGLSYIWEKEDYPLITKIEKYITLKPFDTINIKILFKEDTNITDNYRYFLKIPIFQDTSILSKKNKQKPGSGYFINLLKQNKRKTIIVEDKYFLKYIRRSKMYSKKTNVNQKIIYFKLFVCDVTRK